MAIMLQPEQLRRTYDPATLSLLSGKEEAPSKAIIGQDRAITALQFGLGNKANGFNIYVAGAPGTGKQTAVRHYLEDLAREEPSPCDWVYVNNFEDPYFPKYLSLPKGLAHPFRNDVHHFLIHVRSDLIKIFESEEFTHKRDELVQQMQEEVEAIFSNINERARAEGLTVQRTPLEVVVLPMIDGRPMNEKEFFALSEEEKATILKKQRKFKDEIRLAARRARDVELEFSNRLQQLEQKAALRTLDALLEDLEEKYGELKAVLTFLEDLKSDLLEHLQEFLQFPSNKEEQPANPLQKEDSVPRRYEVNVLVDNKGVDGAPIVLEINPTYSNLFGKIEKESMMGTFVTDLTLIRSGSLHRANGGYLILPIEEILRNYFTWDSLKRALRTGQIDIEEPGERLGFLTSKSLKPEPVPLQVQVILIGRPLYYYLLLEYDEDFRELFKVKADFDVEMEHNEAHVSDFVGFIQHICRQEELLPLDAGGMAQLLEESHRLAEDQEKISTRFGEIIDMVREAHHYARKEAAEAIGAAYIRQAVEQRIYRSGLYKEKIRELIDRGQIIIDLEGEKTGQVNGLAYIAMGDIAFGRPSRITASTSVGHTGIVDIEREVQLGGPIHSKGVLILSGYLSEKFGQDKVISLSANLTFEQSFSEVEGDSASSAELYALLSSLSGLPIRQGIAVSGSVNQKGQVQAVGGINEKIEGFFDICRIKGLTGEQGVLIPERNLKQLMLKDEVVQAVREGKFHLWAVNNIGEGIEILMGVPAGVTPEGDFEDDSVFAKVDERLKEIRKILREEKLPARPLVKPRQMRRIMRMRRERGDGKRKVRRI